MIPMISYAQNFEDVILERIFKGKESGFYVDIGACHPIYDSVTHHFYLKGWSGINLEPQPALFAELVSVRSRDINLNVCAGKQSGRMTLAITKGIGTSTLDPVLAEKYRCDQSVVEEIEVELITLDHLWNEYVGERRVDFLKIDVEGFEQNVLLGANFEKIAPSIIVIEATQPNSEELCHDQWEYLLRDHYEFLYFDGLNRFYQRKGLVLEAAFKKTPPNVFDHFITYPHLLLEQANATLLEDREELNGQLQGAQAQLLLQERALAEAAGAYQALQAVHQAKADEMRLAQELLERLHGDLAAQANAVDQFENNQAQLLLKEQALAEAVSAYQALQAAYQAKVDELCLAQELLERLHGDLAVHARNAADQFEQSQAHLLHKEQALAEAVSVYQALQAAYQVKVDELHLTRELLQDKDEALLDASQSYQHLVFAHELKDQDLQAQIRQLSIDLHEAKDRSEEIQEGFYTKDQALTDAAKAYQHLRDAFDEKTRELAELHTRFATQSQANASKDNH